MHFLVSLQYDIGIMQRYPYTRFSLSPSLPLSLPPSLPACLSLSLSLCSPSLTNRHFLTFVNERSRDCTLVQIVLKLRIHMIVISRGKGSYNLSIATDLLPFGIQVVKHAIFHVPPQKIPK